MKDRRIGLALSSGGLFGFAHAGVIEHLEDHGVRPNLISGSSAGAIIGLVYAQGGRVGLEKFLQDLRISGLLSKRGLFRAMTPDRYFEQIGKLLKKTIKETDLRQLPVPFYPVATDLETGEAKIFTSGDPVKTTLASATYPGAFLPKTIDGHSYIDGGITSYIPVEALEEKGADLIIGSAIRVLDELGHKKAMSLNRASLAIRSIQILQEKLCEKQLDDCDYIVRPEFNANDWYRLDRLDYIIETGRQAAERSLAALTKPTKSGWGRPGRD